MYIRDYERVILIFSDTFCIQYFHAYNFNSSWRKVDLDMCVNCDGHGLYVKMDTTTMLHKVISEVSSWSFKSILGLLVLKIQDFFFISVKLVLWFIWLIVFSLKLFANV